MKLITHRLSFTEGDCFPFFFWGDWHRFNANCSKKELEADRRTIAETPNALYAHMGDGADCIARDDKRYTAAEVDWSLIRPQDMDKFAPLVVRDLVDFEAPVANRCVAKLRGNHETAFGHWHHCDVVWEVCERLGRGDLYAPGEAMVRLIFTDAHRHACTVVLNLHHGTHTARYRSTLLNQLLIKLRYWPTVDIMARGHCHFRDFSSEMRMATNANFSALHQRRAMAVLSGGYLKTFCDDDGAGYAEMKDLDPIDIGMQRVNIYPSRHGARLEAVA
jgi:hypothetical protein